MTSVFSPIKEPARERVKPQTQSVHVSRYVRESRGKSESTTRSFVGGDGGGRASTSQTARSVVVATSERGERHCIALRRRHRPRIRVYALQNVQRRCFFIHTHTQTLGDPVTHSPLRHFLSGLPFSRIRCVTIRISASLSAPRLSYPVPCPFPPLSLERDMCVGDSRLERHPRAWTSTSLGNGLFPVPEGISSDMSTKGESLPRLFNPAPSWISYRRHEIRNVSFGGSLGAAWLQLGYRISWRLFTYFSSSRLFVVADSGRYARTGDGS